MELSWVSGRLWCCWRIYHKLMNESFFDFILVVNLLVDAECWNEPSAISVQQVALTLIRRFAFLLSFFQFFLSENFPLPLHTHSLSFLFYSAICLVVNAYDTNNLKFKTICRHSSPCFCDWRVNEFELTVHSNDFDDNNHIWNWVELEAEKWENEES